MPNPKAGRRSKNLLRSALVALQVSVCMVLLLAAGLFLRGLRRANTIDPGFRMKNVAAISFDLNGAGYNDKRAEALQRGLLEQIGALPGVDAVAQASAIPLDDNHRVTDFSIPGREGEIMIEYNQVSPGLFPVVGYPDHARPQFYRNRKPVGHTGGNPHGIDGAPLLARRGSAREDIRGGSGVTYEVVGIAKDAQVAFLGKSNEPYAYFPAGPKEQLGVQLLVSSAGGNPPTAQTLRRRLPHLIRNWPWMVVKLDDNLKPWQTPGRIVSTLSGFLSALALLLASIGVYGLVSYVVSRRVREIGIRMALGANSREVMIFVLRQAMRPVVVGASIGLVCCVALCWVLSTVSSGRLLYGISPVDPVAFLVVPGFLLSAAFLACWIPARRAMRVDPMVALRYEDRWVGGKQVTN